MTPKPASRRRPLVTRLFASGDLPPAAVALLSSAALGVGVAAYLHGRLYHEGYAHVFVVGPLFLLNEIGSGLVIVTLLMRRYAIFAAGALSISVGAIVSILISHSTSFFGFAEHAYGWRATTIVIAEIFAAATTLLGLATAGRRILPPPSGAVERARRPDRLRVGPASSTAGVLVLAATALVAIGFGQGSPPVQPPISTASRAREVVALAHAGGAVARGEALFGADGCADCHAIAAGGYTGQLGPRLDAAALPAAVVQAIVDSPPLSVRGFQADLMPRDFATRLPAHDVRDIADYVAAAGKAAG